MLDGRQFVVRVGVLPGQFVLTLLNFFASHGFAGEFQASLLSFSVCL